VPQSPHYGTPENVPAVPFVPAPKLQQWKEPFWYI
jgi:hypothetical protein